MPLSTGSRDPGPGIGSSLSTTGGFPLEKIQKCTYPWPCTSAASHCFPVHGHVSLSEPSVRHPGWNVFGPENGCFLWLSGNVALTLNDPPTASEPLGSCATQCLAEGSGSSEFTQSSVTSSFRSVQGAGSAVAYSRASASISVGQGGPGGAERGGEHGER